MKYFILASLSYLLLALGNTARADVDALKFTLHKLDSGTPGPTMLVIGGIQGDEPGGFNAASLLVTDYLISSGQVWVVPNLNFASIIKRSRGIHGDMNRKFADIPSSDPEFNEVQAIKSIILDEQVDIVLNLHDGSGFYRPKYIDRLHNPNRWGQSIIIDQAALAEVEFGDLKTLADHVVRTVNGKIKNKSHHYAVKNTHTKKGDTEMEKTLTYFAIRHNRPAFGIEASKSFLTHDRTLFHLKVVEAFMQEMKIDYQRSFSLTSRAVKRKIDNNVKLALYENRIYLDMRKARSRLSYVPMQKNSPLQFSASNPLVAVIGNKNYFQVRYGNRGVTRLQPQYFEFDDSLRSVSIEVDGNLRKVKFGTAINVTGTFKVMPIDGYRINVIGYSRKGLKNESGIEIGKHDIVDRFSIDKQAQLYRVEFYRKDKFCGMVLVNFSTQPRA